VACSFFITVFLSDFCAGSSEQSFSMAFKPISRNPLCRTIDLTDINWEYDAPQFFDFSRVDDKENIEESDYFSMLLCFMYSC